MSENTQGKKSEMTPVEYFKILKNKRKTVTDKDLDKFYESCEILARKFEITGQVEGLRKLLFHMKCIEREREIVKLGVNTFVYRQDVEDYIDNIASKVVKIIELENYPRPIPNEIVDVIAKVKDKFDQLYVVFTDYTGAEERKVEKERQAADPILFGTFQDLKSRSVVDRFYYLGDWEDKYCDLTLDKLVSEVRVSEDRDIAIPISTPVTVEEIESQIASLRKPGNEDNSERELVMTKPEKGSFFGKIRTLFKEK